MNIDPKSLQKRSEQEFLNAEPNPVLAKTQYRYYMMKRLDNFNKIKDFLERAQNQTFHHSRPIYMSKEHGKMLMQKALKFKADLLNSYGVTNNHASNPSLLNVPDTVSDTASVSNKRDHRRASVSSYQTSSAHEIKTTKVLQKRIFDTAVTPETNVPGSVKNINEMLKTRLEYRDKLLYK